MIYEHEGRRVREAFADPSDAAELGRHREDLVEELRTLLALAWNDAEQVERLPLESDPELALDQVRQAIEYQDSRLATARRQEAKVGDAVEAILELDRRLGEVR